MFGVIYQDDDEEERVASLFCLNVILGLSGRDQTPEAGKRLGTAMRQLGWEGPLTLRIGGQPMKGYRRQHQREPWD
jgi:hypothetical protein